MIVRVNEQDYEFNSNGTWKHIPNESILLKSETPFKKDGSLKAQYKDMPRFKLISIYEEDFSNKFKETLKDITKEVLRELSKNI